MKTTKLLATVAGIVLAAQGLVVSAKVPKLVTGIEASQRVSELTTDIPWNRSLSQAEETARKQGKMVFWVQMLGDMAGAT